MEFELIDRAEMSAHEEATFTHWPRGPDMVNSADATGISTAMATAGAFLAEARTMDLRGADPVERLRAWCQAGDAMLALGTAGDLYCLQQAAAAYSMAEALLDGAPATVVERVHVHHAHGCTLLRLAGGCDVELAAAAGTRLASALSLARRHIPERVAGIKLELCRAEHVIAIRPGAPTVRPQFDE